MRLRQLFLSSAQAQIHRDKLEGGARPAMRNNPHRAQLGASGPLHYLPQSEVVSCSNVVFFASPRLCDLALKTLPRSHGCGIVSCHIRSEVVMVIRRTDLQSVPIGFLTNGLQFRPTEVHADSSVWRLCHAAQCDSITQD